MLKNSVIHQLSPINEQSQLSKISDDSVDRRSKLYKENKNEIFLNLIKISILISPLSTKR